ncbi:STAS domain-containing protein [bacterium]|nr:STAS domain-containing protein [bacterium]
MTADRTPPPILLIRGEAHFVGKVEFALLDGDGNERSIASREHPPAGTGLEAMVQEIATAGTDFQDVIVDLEKVVWLNSTGLGWLVGLARQRKQQGDSVVLTGANERVAKLLHVTSLDLALPMHETIAAAAAALRTDGEGPAR